MKKVQLNGVEYLVEINWAETTTKKFNDDFIRLSKENSTSKFAIVHKLKEKATIGVLTGENKKPTLKSAALYLANANENQIKNLNLDLNKGFNSWVIVERLDLTEENKEEGYWVCAVVNGIPMLYSDKIVKTAQEAQSEIISTVHSILDLSQNIEIYVTEDLIKKSLKENFSKQDVVKINSKSFEEIIENVKYLGQVKKLSTISPNVKLAILGVLIAGALYFGYEEYQNYMDSVEENTTQVITKTNKLQELEKQLSEYENQKEKDFKTFVENYEKEINKQISSPNLVEVLSSWNGVLFKQPYSVGGWRQAGLICNSIENTTKCTFYYDRIKGQGTNATIIKQFPQIKIANDGEKAQLEVEGKVLNIVEKELSKLVNIEDFQIKEINKLQSLEPVGIVKKFSELTDLEKDIVLPNPPKGIKQETTGLPKLKLGVGKGSFEIGGNGLYKLKSLENELKGLDLQIKDIVVDFSGDGIWVIKGDYYVKNKSSNVNDIVIPKSKISN